jgi:hypothetical protein
MQSTDPILTAAHRALPRLLCLFDDDPVSPTYGYGDRLYWGWKLIDFANGAFQGAAHGLARLLAAGLLPDALPKASAIRRIKAMFAATRAMTRRNGSLEEAYPYESSFCVTALIAYDLVAAVDLLRDEIDQAARAEMLDAIRPLTGFLLRNSDTHAVISNHLATAAAALFRWHAITADEAAEARARHFVERLLSNFSDEGWFREYDGADPGYQTLCMDFLADIALLRRDLKLEPVLPQAIRFLSHCAHPDGSFSGIYGSRNTRFYFPAGVESLAGSIPEAAALADWMAKSIAELKTVTLDAVDMWNLPTLFNSYCWAAALRAGRGPAAAPPALPCHAAPFRKTFDGAGLIIDRGTGHYTIVSWHKGGVAYHFDGDRAKVIDTGVVAKRSDGALFSSQAYEASNRIVWRNENEIEITAPLMQVSWRRPTPATFVLLRTACLTLMRIPIVNRLAKRFLVRLLITAKHASGASNRRRIAFGPHFSIADEWAGPSSGLERVKTGRPFSAIHMSSQGYWQASDDMLTPADADQPQQ